MPLVRQQSAVTQAPERSPVSDEEVAVRACQGDREAFAELFRRFAPRVFRTVLRITGSEAEADDGTQEIFLRIHERLSSFERRSSLSTWIYRIAVNIALDRTRSQQRAPGGLAGVDVPAGGTASEGAERREFERSVQAALDGVSEKLRSVLVLRYLEDLSYEEIAEVLECSVGTVKSRLARAHEAIGPAMKEIGRKREEGEL